jgi:hypothetical protein
MCGVIRRTFKGKTLDTQIKFYQVMEVHTLLHGSEFWTMGKKRHAKIAMSRNSILKSG